MTLKIAILETGLPPLAIRPDWPRYPSMFERLLAPADPGLEFEAVSLAEGEALPAPDAFDAYLITGSPAGVYEDHPWMQPLFDFIRAVAATGKPQVGICFGHQAIAQALGGQVVKSPKGWGIGRHVYAITHAPDWLDGAPEAVAMAVSHQDQVIAPPPGAQVLARSEFCEYAALHDPAARTLSFQGHPEFGPAFCRALYGVRRGTVLPEAMVDEASQSLEAPLDNDAVARWIAAFIRAA